MDQRSEAVLAPIYGVMVPFHVLTVKGAAYSADGDHAVIRLNFNFGPGWEPGQRHPGAIMLKELSYRSSDTRHAQKARAAPRCAAGARACLRGVGDHCSEGPGVGRSSSGEWRAR